MVQYRSNFSFLSSTGLRVFGVIFIVIVLFTVYEESKYISSPPVVRNDATKFESSSSSYSIHHIVTDEDYISVHKCVMDRKESKEYVPIKEDEIYEYSLQFTSLNDVRLFQLCYSNDEHQHLMKFKVKNNNDYDNCDLYLSSTHTEPSSERWDWKSASNNKEESVNLYSYADELVAAGLNSVFVAVTNRNVRSNCKFSVEIISIINEELLKRLGLRGGQVLLPNDLHMHK